MTELKIRVTPEGRDGVWLIEDRDSLKAWIDTYCDDTIHNMISAAGIAIGADHDKQGVLNDVDRALRIAVMTGPALTGNLHHAVSMIHGATNDDARLGIYDIGEVTIDDLDVVQ